MSQLQLWHYHEYSVLVRIDRLQFFFWGEVCIGYWEGAGTTPVVCQWNDSSKMERHISAIEYTAGGKTATRLPTPEFRIKLSEITDKVATEKGKP